MCVWGGGGILFFCLCVKLFNRMRRFWCLPFFVYFVLLAYLKKSFWFYIMKQTKKYHRRHSFKMETSEFYELWQSSWLKEQTSNGTLKQCARQTLVGKWGEKSPLRGMGNLLSVRCPPPGIPHACCEDFFLFVTSKGKY